LIRISNSASLGERFAMKLFGILVAISTIQSATAFPKRENEPDKKRLRLWAHPESPGQIADGDSLAGAVNHNLPTCPGIPFIEDLMRRVGLLEVAHVVNEVERGQNDIAVANLLLNINGCMNILNTAELSDEYKVELWNSLEEMKQRVQERPGINAGYTPNPGCTAQ
jgi:hypothetical protein